MSEFKGLLSKGEDLKKMVDEAISKLRTEKYKESAEMLHKLESETRDLRNQILAIQSRESQSPDYDMEGMVKQQGHGMKIAVTNTVENFMMVSNKSVKWKCLKVRLNRAKRYSDKVITFF